MVRRADRKTTASAPKPPAARPARIPGGRLRHPTGIDSTEEDPAGGNLYVGGAVYRRADFPALQGTSAYGDSRSGTIRGLSKSAGVWENSVRAATSHRISAIREDEAGTLYVADCGTGTVYRIMVP